MSQGLAYQCSRSFRGLGVAEWTMSLSGRKANPNGYTALVSFPIHFPSPLFGLQTNDQGLAQLMGKRRWPHSHHSTFPLQNIRCHQSPPHLHTTQGHIFTPQQARDGGRTQVESEERGKTRIAGGREKAGAGGETPCNIRPSPSIRHQSAGKGEVQNREK